MPDFSTTRYIPTTTCTRQWWGNTDCGYVGCWSYPCGGREGRCYSNHQEDQTYPEACRTLPQDHLQRKQVHKEVSVIIVIKRSSGTDPETSIGPTRPLSTRPSNQDTEVISVPRPYLAHPPSVLLKDQSSQLQSENYVVQRRKRLLLRRRSRWRGLV